MAATWVRKKMVSLQRSAAPDRCWRCGAGDVALESDPVQPGKMQCSFRDIKAWSACREKWRSQCPPWCARSHSDVELEEGKWFHNSTGIEVVFATEPGRTPAIVRVDLCTLEDVGGDLEPVTIHIGDTAMTPAQARAYASALIASADMAEMTPLRTRQLTQASTETGAPPELCRAA
jgi:hypothetical protein